MNCRYYIISCKCNRAFSENHQNIDEILNPYLKLLRHGQKEPRISCLSTGKIASPSFFPFTQSSHTGQQKNRQIFPAAMGSRPPKGGGCRHSLGEDKYGITLIGFNQSDRARFKGRQRKALCLWFSDFCFEA